MSVATSGLALRLFPDFATLIRATVASVTPGREQSERTRNDETETAITTTSYSVTVCTTLPSGRLLTVGSFMSLTRPASYSANVSNDAFAFICTTL